MTMNQGLFDISVDVGTDDDQGIVHTGETSGPANVAASDNHTIYMAAVPKNQALTMLLGGTIGFDAGAADVENGQIILSAGATKRYDGTFEYFFVNDAEADANIDFSTGEFTSAVNAFATSDITAVADDGSLSCGDGLRLTGFDSVELGATSGKALTVSGSTVIGTGQPFSGAPGTVFVHTQGEGSSALLDGDLTIYASGQHGQGGDVTIRADGSALTVTGVAAAYADGSFADAATSDRWAGDGYGGTINVQATNGGTLTTGGLTLSANGTGQDGYGYYSSRSSSGGGSGSGGYIYVDAASGGVIDVNGNVSATANGTGGDLLGGDTWAGDGWGGDVYVNTGDPYSTTGNGDLHVTGNVSLTADGTGGSVTGADATGYGGDGYGGEANVYSWGSGNLKLDGTSLLTANALGGNGSWGGYADGGTAGIGAVAGTVTLGGDATVAATGRGGNASVSFGGDGGDATGGVAFIEADSDPGYPGEIDPTAGTITGNLATIDTSGTGGTGGKGDGVDIAAGDGGYGQGGYYCGGDCAAGGAFALAQVGGASLTLGQVTLTSNGTGGAGGVGGAGKVGGNGGEGWGGSVQAGGFDPNAAGTTDLCGLRSIGLGRERDWRQRRSRRQRRRQRRRRRRCPWRWRFLQRPGHRHRRLDPHARERDRRFGELRRRCAGRHSRPPRL